MRGRLFAIAKSFLDPLGRETRVKHADDHGVRVSEPILKMVRELADKDAVIVIECALVSDQTALHVRLRLAECFVKLEGG